ncbi:unnamed protein product, partial [Bubo scandiacus]
KFCLSLSVCVSVSVCLPVSTLVRVSERMSFSFRPLLKSLHPVVLICSSEVVLAGECWRVGVEVAGGSMPLGRQLSENGREPTTITHCSRPDPIRGCTFPAHGRARGHAREVPPPPPCALSAGARGAKRGTAAPVPPVSKCRGRSTAITVSAAASCPLPEGALRTRCLALIPVLVARVTAGAGGSVGRAGGAPGAGSEAAGSGPSLSGPVLEEEPVRAEGAAERRGAGPRGRSPGGCRGKPRRGGAAR